MLIFDLRSSYEVVCDIVFLESSNLRHSVNMCLTVYHSTPHNSNIGR